MPYAGQQYCEDGTRGGDKVRRGKGGESAAQKVQGAVPGNDIDAKNQRFFYGRYTCYPFLLLGNPFVCLPARRSMRCVMTLPRATSARISTANSSTFKTHLFFSNHVRNSL